MNTLLDSAHALPMASAPMKYAPDGRVLWDEMWDGFCALAQTGGPPHRGTLLQAEINAVVDGDGYQTAAAEIVRGIGLVSGMHARPALPGWIAIECESSTHARWLADAITCENVQARTEHALLLVPCGEQFTVKGEIKNVVTAVAKTTHYWREHMQREVKSALKFEQSLRNVRARLMARFAPGQKPHADDTCPNSPSIRSFGDTGRRQPLENVRPASTKQHA